jgi:hypothetical protein
MVQAGRRPVNPVLHGIGRATIGKWRGFFYLQLLVFPELDLK